MPETMLICDACASEFLFTEAEQAYCETNAFPPPTRCPECQQRRKDAKAEERGGQRRGSYKRGRRR